MRCSVPQSTVLSVSLFIVESADREPMSASVAVRAGIWLRTAHRKEVGLEVMLSLVLIYRMQQKPSLLRGTGSTPIKEGGAGEVRLCGHRYVASILNFCL